MADQAQRVEVRWDPLARAWHLIGDPAGPAGHAMIEVGGLIWYADWASPDRLVEAYLCTSDDTISGTLDETGLGVLARVLGQRAADTLASTAATAPDSSFDIIGGVPESARRRALGRLARALAEIRWAEGSTWWSVEALHRAHDLGVGLELLTVDSSEEIADDAFELVDSIPSTAVRQLVAQGLGPVIRTVFDHHDIADHELPEALRLTSEESDRRWLDILERNAIAEPDSQVGTHERGTATATGPTLLGGENWLARSGEQLRSSGEIHRADVAPGTIESCKWTTVDGKTTFNVVARPSSWRVGYRVHITNGNNRSAVQLERSDEQPDLELIHWTGTAETDTASGDGAYELSQFDTLEDLAPELAERRHAVALGRDGDYWARAAWVTRSADLWSRAAESWEATGEAWATAGDLARARLARIEAARCSAHAGQPDRVRQLADVDPADPLLADDTVDLDDSITERIIALVDGFIESAIAQTDLLTGEDGARLAQDLEVLALSLGMVDRAAGARQVITRWQRSTGQSATDS